MKDKYGLKRRRSRYWAWQVEVPHGGAPLTGDEIPYTKTQAKSMARQFGKGYFAREVTPRRRVFGFTRSVEQ